MPIILKGAVYIYGLILLLICFFENISLLLFRLWNLFFFFFAFVSKKKYDLVIVSVRFCQKVAPFSVSQLQKPSTPLTSPRRRKRRMPTKTRITSHQLHRSTPTRRASAPRRITTTTTKMTTTTYSLLNQRSLRTCILPARRPRSRSLFRERLRTHLCVRRECRCVICLFCKCLYL